ncbi:MAG: type II secretion system protein GspG [Planctomycetota bacterium]|jgi:hypothetical protein
MRMKPDVVMSRAKRAGLPAIAAALLAAPVAHGADVVKPSATEEAKFFRVEEEAGQWVSLQLAVREFARPQGGPRVVLVGVTHIGERSYYRALQSVLDEHDVVLYESVMPSGTGGAGGETLEERIDSTHAAMQFVASAIEAHHLSRGSYPEDDTALRAFVVGIDSRLADGLDVAMLDAWGRRLVYRTDENAAGYTLVSLGADGRPGGSGAAGDLDLAALELPEPLAISEEDNIQAELASALNLAFQLHAIDYDRPHWRLSDMSVDQIQRALAERGADWGVLGGTLAGSSFPARVVKVLLRFMRFADTFVEGAISDTVKVALIEMLGDETLIDESMKALGEEFAEVLIDVRNQVVIDDLRSVLESEPEVESIAIFYGAGHMPDLAERLASQLEYEAGDAQWLDAIRVDLTRSRVDARQMRQLRFMMRQMMREQARMSREARESE